MFLYFIIYFSSSNEIPINEKVTFRKRFNFHKRQKNCSSTKSASPACNNSRKTLTTDGIAQLRQLMDFLLEEQSKFYKELSFILVLLLVCVII